MHVSDGSTVVNEKQLTRYADADANKVNAKMPKCKYKTKDLFGHFGNRSHGSGLLGLATALSLGSSPSSLLLSNDNSDHFSLTSSIFSLHGEDLFIRRSCSGRRAEQKWRVGTAGRRRSFTAGVVVKRRAVSEVEEQVVVGEKRCSAGGVLIVFVVAKRSASRPRRKCA